MTTKFLSQIASLFGATAFGGFTTYYGLNSKMNHRNKEALDHLLSEYSKDEYRQSLRELYLFKKKNDDFVKRYIYLFEKNTTTEEEEEFNKIDRARRTIWNFSVRLYLASDAGVFNPSLIKSAQTVIWGKSFYGAIIDIIEPIMKQYPHPVYNKKYTQDVLTWAREHNEAESTSSTTNQH